MVDITLYGTPTYTYKYLKEMLVVKSGLVGIDITLNEVNDLDQILEQNISRVPTFQIGVEQKYITDESPNKFLQDLYQWVLEKENYENMMKIIVPIDYSDASMNALEYAIEYGRKIGAAIRVLHVYNPKPIQSSENLISPEFITEDVAREKFDKHISKLNDRNDSKHPLIEGQFEVGFAAEVIIEESNASNTLLIMSNSGASGIKKIFGSVSTKIANQASCPVIMIPTQGSYKPYRNIVYAGKNQELDLDLAKSAIKLIKNFEPNLHLVHVTNNSKYDIELIQDKWQENYNGGSVTSVTLEVNEVSGKINEYAQSKNAELIIIARENKSLLQTLFNKDMLKKIIIDANLPVLIISQPNH